MKRLFTLVFLPLFLPFRDDPAVDYFCHSIDNNTFSYVFSQSVALIRTTIRARHACLAINYKWWAYWHAFPSIPRIYRQFLWLWKYWVRNGRRTIFQYLNSFFQEVNLIFQFFNFSQKLFLFHVYSFCFYGIAYQICKDCPRCNVRKTPNFAHDAVYM